MDYQRGNPNTFHSAPSVEVQAQATAPRPISRPMAPYIASTNCAVANERQILPSFSPLPYGCRAPQFHYIARSISRSHSPPSLTPSPAPSLFSYDTDHHDDTLEIEEISDSEEDGDSGIELLVGEYEEAPEDYGRVAVMGYCEDEDVAKTHRHILYGMERLSANRNPSPMCRVMPPQQWFRQGEQRKSKRAYAESVEASDSECDSSFDFESFRRTRRRLGRNVDIDVSCETLSVSSRASSVQPTDFEVDMEL